MKITKRLFISNKSIKWKFQVPTVFLLWVTTKSKIVDKESTLFFVKYRV